MCAQPCVDSFSQQEQRHAAAVCCGSKLTEGAAFSVLSRPSNKCYIIIVVVIVIIIIIIVITALRKVTLDRFHCDDVSQSGMAVTSWKAMVNYRCCYCKLLQVKMDLKAVVHCRPWESVTHLLACPVISSLSFSSQVVVTVPVSTPQWGVFLRFLSSSHHLSSPACCYQNLPVVRTPPVCASSSQRSWQRF